MIDTAVRLLRDLPRGRHDIARAKQVVRAWNDAHPDYRATLVADAPPGAVVVDYDLLLERPGEGTLALSWRGDAGTPWSVCYADHWAANFVVTVDDAKLTVQQALLILRMASEARPELATAMVDHLLFQQLADDSIEVTDDELQHASDEFRRDHGLLTADATRAWLVEHRLTEDQLAATLEQRVRIGKAKDRIVAERIATWRGDVDRVRVLEVAIADASARAAARERGLFVSLPMLGPADTAKLATRALRDLPAAVRSAGPGDVVEADGVLYKVLDRYAADDAETRRAILDAWAAERRATATVRWHWF